MTGDDFRAPRTAKTWMALLFGGGCLMAGAHEAAALSVTAGPFSPELILIQEQSESAADTAGGQMPAETTPGAAAAGSFTELNKALAAARERLEELSKAAEAVAATGQLRQELTALKEKNQQLVTEIEALRAADKELADAKQTAEARVVELSEALEEAKARARQIDDELVAVRWQNAQLNTSLAQTRAAREEVAAETRQTQEALRAKVEALETDSAQTTAVVARLREQLEQRDRQLAEMRDRSQQAEEEKTRAAEQLAAVEGQLSTAREQAASAQQDRAQLEQRSAQLESQVAELRAAAGTATDVARQNLIAVEQRIKELNDALAAIVPAAAPASADNSATGAVSDDGGGGQVATEPAASGADATLAAIKTGNVQRPSDEESTVPLLANLSLEQRLHVEGLLADLKGTMDEQGLRLVVPGGVLFALNSEDVRDSAHSTLAKVAELINIYDDRKVRIIGHTDALGDAAYNEELSERRAGLVKQFFVDNFDVDETRLSTQGAGEADPIASNATLEGRRANRRVEVLILN